MHSDTFVSSDTQYGVDGEIKAKRGRFHCLVAAQRLDAMTSAALEPSREQEVLQTAAAVPPFFRSLLPEHLQVCTRGRTIVGSLLAYILRILHSNESCFQSIQV